MRLISKKELIAKKRHDSLAVMATGWSINNITDQEWDVLDNNYDLFGINWFCRSYHLTTWYLVREQACKPLRQCEEQGYTIENFVRIMRLYGSSCKIVKDTGYRKDHYHYHEHLDRFNGEGMVFKEPPRTRYADRFVDDMFEHGIHHGKCTIYEPLHFAVQMGYKRIVLCGVDLYDNRYFYFNYGETLEQLKPLNRTCESQHLTAQNTITLMETFKEYFPNIHISVHNPKSMLAGTIPVWDGK